MDWCDGAVGKADDIMAKGMNDAEHNQCLFACD